MNERSNKKETMDNEQDNATIRQMANKELTDEIHYQMHDVDEQRELDGYDEVDALDDIVEIITSNGDAPAMLRHCREIEIALGRYRPITDEELSRIVVTRGRKYDFKLKGAKYVLVR